MVLPACGGLSTLALAGVKNIVINHQISSDPSFGKHYRAVMLLHCAVVYDGYTYFYGGSCGGRQRPSS